MPNLTPLTPRFIVLASVIAFASTAAHGEKLVLAPKSKFVFKDANGKSQSAEIVTKYQPKKIGQTVAKIDRSLDPKLMRAASIAEERANAHSRSRCWQYVKEAL